MDSKTAAMGLFKMEKTKSMEERRSNTDGITPSNRFPICPILIIQIPFTRFLWAVIQMAHLPHLRYC